MESLPVGPDPQHHAISIDTKGLTGVEKSKYQREGSAVSALSFFSGNHKRSLPSIKFTNEITDYDLISDIGGVDDISFLYLAKFIPSGETVALKYTDLTISPDYLFVDELIRSVHNTKMCKHPNVLPYFHTFVENERLWSVTYPVRAGTCRRILKDHFKTGFTEAVVAAILKEVLKAILYMHQNHMIHNDIRANNILIDQHGEVRITGLRQVAHFTRDGEYVQSIFSLVGDNIEWAAPEVITQKANYDEKADVYSLGITALELAFNKTPFDDWPPLKVLLCKLEYECPAIKSDKQMSKNFHRFVQACLVKDPRDRPSVMHLLEFPFIKQAKGTGFIESHVVRRMGEHQSSPHSESSERLDTTSSEKTSAKSGDNSIQTSFNRSSTDAAPANHSKFRIRKPKPSRSASRC
ncbi:hypothetical protein BASA81_009037 [Batrachochytrium salamandrivorans]|nr:hypothetical protein BASA81_009037 [Batrachochytrium salamandrivorans]